MIWQKVIHGYVIQRFDDKKCIDMHFTAGDEVVCEAEGGQLLDQPEHNYQHFDMTIESLASLSDQIQEDLLTFLEGQSNYVLDAVCLIVVNRLNK